MCNAAYVYKAVNRPKRKSKLLLNLCKIRKKDISVAILESFNVYQPWTNKLSHQAVHSHSCGQIFGFR